MLLNLHRLRLRLSILIVKLRLSGLLNRRLLIQSLVRRSLQIRNLLSLNKRSLVRWSRFEMSLI